MIFLLFHSINYERNWAFPRKGIKAWLSKRLKNKQEFILGKKQDFIWNATNLTRLIRQGLIDLFTTYKAWVRIVYLETPYPTLIERNKTREYPVPSKILEKFIRRLEVPELDEAHEIDYFVDL